MRAVPTAAARAITTIVQIQIIQPAAAATDI